MNIVKVKTSNVKVTRSRDVVVDIKAFCLAISTFSAMCLSVALKNFCLS